jgi:hypothetical protein
MKFRFVLLEPDEDPDQHILREKGAPAAPLRKREGLCYEQSGTGIVRVERRSNGALKSTPVSNFTARIVRDLILDDGRDQRRHFSLEAELNGRRVAYIVPAAEFQSMGWVLHKLGPQAIIYPGQQQHARAAIQWLSGEIPQEHSFTHLGWRKIGGEWVYLHAGGALGVDGNVSGVQVQLSAVLQAYHVP